jgi:hypothetical protein
MLKPVVSDEALMAPADANLVEVESQYGVGDIHGQKRLTFSANGKNSIDTRRDSMMMITFIVLLPTVSKTVFF